MSDIKVDVAPLCIGCETCYKKNESNMDFYRIHVGSDTIWMCVECMKELQNAICIALILRGKEWHKKD